MCALLVGLDQNAEKRHVVVEHLCLHIAPSIIQGTRKIESSTYRPVATRAGDWRSALSLWCCAEPLSGLQPTPTDAHV